MISELRSGFGNRVAPRRQSLLKVPIASLTLLLKLSNSGFYEAALVVAAVLSHNLIHLWNALLT
jgi:hypothetical protein